MALVKCPDCQGKLSTLAKKCPHCGRPLKKNELAPCPECGEIIDSSADICRACGFPIGKARSGKAGCGTAVILTLAVVLTSVVVLGIVH